MTAEQIFAGRLIMAPMTRGTNLPFRRLAAEWGAEVCVGEMAYAHKVAKRVPAEMALLRRHLPDHPFWSGGRFARLWRFAQGAEHRRALDESPVAWPYNPVGIEMAYALETLEGPGARARSAGSRG